ncbi:hypothetical protein BV898_19214 [Hypsibius exemplaris]|uniref:Uncharacterized protein n=1 Tax=Hypsibius exemplaris TaxID=2072580 RepID=A0A9X6NIV6_HYPEX|nr:hypothetical protein BV898_19214 [Hypsibius exemplaris]
MELVDEISKTFQVIFILSYVMDFLNVIGSSAFFLNANMVTSYWSYIYYTATFCMFGLYATALAYPLIQVVEKPTTKHGSSKEISKRLRQLS